MLICAPPSVSSLRSARRIRLGTRRVRSTDKEPIDDGFPRKAEVIANVGKDRCYRAHAKRIVSQDRDVMLASEILSGEVPRGSVML